MKKIKTYPLLDFIEDMTPEGHAIMSPEIEKEMGAIMGFEEGDTPESFEVLPRNKASFYIRNKKSDQKVVVEFDIKRELVHVYK